jgi:hypothetical protein
MDEQMRQLGNRLQFLLWPRDGGHRLRRSPSPEARYLIKRPFSQDGPVIVGSGVAETKWSDHRSDNEALVANGYVRKSGRDGTFHRHWRLTRRDVSI